MSKLKKLGGGGQIPFERYAGYFDQYPEDYFESKETAQVASHLDQYLSSGQLDKYQKFLHMLAGLGMFELTGSTYKPKERIRAFGEWYVDPPARTQMENGTVEVAATRRWPANYKWPSTYLYDIRNPGGILNGDVVVEVEGCYEDAYPEIFIINDLNIMCLVAIRKNDRFLEREERHDRKLIESMMQGRIPRLG